MPVQCCAGLNIYYSVLTGPTATKLTNMKKENILTAIAVTAFLLLGFGLWNNSGKYVSVYNGGNVTKLHFTHLTNVSVLNNSDGSQTLFVGGVNYFMSSCDSIKIN